MQNDKPSKNSKNSKNSKKILVPLATLALAGAVAIGSGADFSSETSTISSVTAGTLSLSNTMDDAAHFEIKDIKPGDSVTGKLTLSNVGSLPASLSLTESKAENDFEENLTLTIVRDKEPANADPLYTGTFGGLSTEGKKALGTIAGGASETFTFTVYLDSGAGNEYQGETAAATYVWDAVQLKGTHTGQ